MKKDHLVIKTSKWNSLFKDGSHWEQIGSDFLAKLLVYAIVEIKTALATKKNNIVIDALRYCSELSNTIYWRIDAD